ncbi:hypothetical protein HYC85_012473 [Camellia sinensis]|uniref:Uncharacterized protein n=1 Tax=Camellia sinensis TaxID=4442 RepID=A0A7J7HC18_CAMSI|nr:hypothetical protein HYC85_012473 [Camellia sinensis]
MASKSYKKIIDIYDDLILQVGFFFRDPYSKGIDPDALKTSLAAACGALTSNKKLEESRHEKPSETEPDQLAEDVKSAPSPDGKVGTGGQTNGKKTLIDAVKPKHKRKKKSSSNVDANGGNNDIQWEISLLQSASTRSIVPEFVSVCSVPLSDKEGRIQCTKLLFTFGSEGWLTLSEDPALAMAFSVARRAAAVPLLLVNGTYMKTVRWQGRTGLMVSAYLVYSGMSAEEALSFGFGLGCLHLGVAVACLDLVMADVDWHGTSYMDKLGFASLTVWNMKTWKAMTVLPLGEDPPAITSLCFNHNGKILAAAATDGMIHMFGVVYTASSIGQMLVKFTLLTRTTKRDLQRPERSWMPYIKKNNNTQPC